MNSISLKPTSFFLSIGWRTVVVCRNYLYWSPFSGCLVVQQGYTRYRSWLQDNYIHFTRNDVYSEMRLYSIYSHAILPLQGWKEYLRRLDHSPSLLCLLTKWSSRNEKQIQWNSYAASPFCTCSSTMLQVFFAVTHVLQHCSTVPLSSPCLLANAWFWLVWLQPD